MNTLQSLLAGRVRYGGCLLVALLLIVPGTARVLAQATPNPPRLMTYQGFLVDGNGDALGDDAPKNYDVVFSIFNEETGGTLLYAEQQTVTVDKGYFSVLLGEGASVGGSFTDLSAVFAGPTASDRFIGITVNGIGPNNTNADILPRLRLVTSPYAFLSTQSSKLVQSNGQDLIVGTPSGVEVLGTVSATSLSGNINANDINSGTLLGVRLQSHLTGTRTFSGNVGISTTTPNHLLSLGNGLANTKLAVWDGGASAYGFGIQSGQFRFHVGGVNDRFSFLNAPNGTEILRLRGNSDFGLGIGANNPDSRFHVQGANWNVARFEGSTSSDAWVGIISRASNGKRYWLRSSAGGVFTIDSGVGSGNMDNIGMEIGGGVSVRSMGGFRARGGPPGPFGNDNNGYAFQGNGGDNDSGMFSSADGVVQFFSNNAERMRLTQHAQILIAKTAAGAASGSTYWPLEVGLRTYTGSFLGQPVPISISIKADGRMEAPAFVTPSDRRIKNIEGDSDNADDLNKVRQLKVTEYSRKDTEAFGNKVDRGFIAQEVQAVLPGAVHVAAGFIPDIYGRAESFQLDQEKRELRVTLTNPHGLQLGERIQLRIDGQSSPGSVTQIVDEHTFVVGDQETAGEVVTVFGREVEDFLTVDYDQIFVTTVGAVQELARQVDALKESEKRVVALESELRAMKNLEVEVAELRRTVQQFVALERLLQESAALQEDLSIRRTSANQVRTLTVLK